jgi:hypothetical protein
MNSIRGSLHAFCAAHPLCDQAENGNRRYEEHQIVESIARVPAGRDQLYICPWIFYDLLILLSLCARLNKEPPQIG